MKERDEIERLTRERDCARAVTAHYLGLVREAEERERRRASLPVLRSCGECGWSVSADPQSYCTLASVAASEMPRTVAPGAVPPAWCPLRGAP